MVEYIIKELKTLKDVNEVNSEVIVSPQNGNVKVAKRDARQY